MFVESNCTNTDVGSSDQKVSWLKRPETTLQNLLSWPPLTCQILNQSSEQQHQSYVVPVLRGSLPLLGGIFLVPWILHWILSLLFFISFKKTHKQWWWFYYTQIRKITLQDNLTFVKFPQVSPPVLVPVYRWVTNDTSLVRVFLVRPTNDTTPVPGLLGGSNQWHRTGPGLRPVSVIKNVSSRQVGIIQSPVNVRNVTNWELSSPKKGFREREMDGSDGTGNPQGHGRHYNDCTNWRGDTCNSGVVVRD